MSQRKFALCGGKRTGKSTLFRTVVDTLSNHCVQYSGFKTFFHESGTLWLEWIHLEYEKIQMGEKTGKHSMQPFLENLDRIGEILLKQDMKSKIFVADEIGFLEQFSKSMQKGILRSISEAPFSFFTIKKEDYPFLKQVKQIEGLRIYDLDGNDWQQKEEWLQSCLVFLAKPVGHT